MANDITYSSGAFGPREDAVFRAITEYALEERLPLIYLAANSGARVGLATELKRSFKVSCGFFPYCHSFAYVRGVKPQILQRNHPSESLLLAA